MRADFSRLEKGAADVSAFVALVQDLVRDVPLLAADALVLQQSTALSDAVHEMREGRFEIAVVGQVKVGKSTLLNALLFAKEVLPASPLPCTAKLTIVEHGDRPSAKAKMVSRDEWRALVALADRAGVDSQTDGLSPEQFAREIVEVAKRGLGDRLEEYLGQEFECSWEELPRYVAAPDDAQSDDVGRLTGLTGQVTLVGPLPWGPRAVIVDTPGISDPNPLREKVTMDHLHRASAVLVLLNAAAPLAASDARFLSHTLIPVGFSKIVVAVNKVDGLDAADRRKVLEYIRGAMSRNVIEPLRAAGTPNALLDAISSAVPIPVSGLLALYAKTSGKFDGADYHGPRLEGRFGFRTYGEAWNMSGAPEIECALEDAILRNEGVATLLGPLRKAIGVIEQGRHVAEVRRADVEEKARDVLKSSEELERAKEDLKIALVKARSAGDRPALRVGDRVKDDFSLWETDLAGALNDLERDLEAEAKRQVDRLSVTDAASHEVAVRLNTTLNWTIREGFENELASRARAFLRRSGKDVAEFLRDELDGLLGGLGLNADAYIVDRVRFAPNIDLPSFESGFMPAIVDRPWYVKLFRPGQGRAELLRDVHDALAAWKAAALTSIKEFARGVQKRMMDEYVEPAIKEVGKSIQDRIAHIEREIAARSADAGNVKERLDGLRMERQEVEAILSRLRNATDSGATLLAALEGAATDGNNVARDQQPSRA